MFSQAPIILALLWAVLLSSCTRSGSGTRYQYNNAKVSTYAEIRDALDGFAARNIALQPTAFAPTWRRTLLRVEVRVKRASAPILLYCTFYPVLLLIHDLELNPGPPSSLRNKPKNRKVNITVAHLNVRSMVSREKFYLVKQTIVHHNYDIFVISESWLDRSTTNNNIQIPGYVILRQDRGPHKSGGGMVVYMRNCFKASIIDNLSTTTDTNSQQLWLKVKCRKTKSFVLCAAYRPGSVSMSRFLDDFSASFMDSLLLGMEVLITGDLNADVLPGSSCLESRALMDLCNSFNLSQLVTKPTRTTDTSKTLIDGRLQQTRVLSSAVM